VTRLAELRVTKQVLKHHWMKPAALSHPPRVRVVAKLAGDAIRHVAHQDFDFLEELSDRRLVNADCWLRWLLLAVLKQCGHGLTECLNLASNSFLSWICLRMPSNQLKNEPCDCIFFIWRILELGEGPRCRFIQRDAKCDSQDPVIRGE